MKLKNYWKRFWTLDRHTSAGFTLVELIVVIAILAILAGVGIPVYSGYITKANKQADLTLISDIEYALTVAGYSGVFEEGDSGTIVLSTTGISGVEAGSNLEKALIAAFGSNYADTLKLKYDSWSNNGFLNTLNPEFAYAVKTSSYMSGGRVNDLLSDVEKMTSMATKLVGALQSAEGVGVNVTLAGLFGDSALNAVADMYGMDKPADWDAWGKENPTAFANMLVLAAANDTQDLDNASMGTNMVLEFSGYYAVAAKNPEFSAYLDAELAKLQTIGKNDDGTDKDAGEIVDAGKAWMENLETEAKKYGFEEPDYSGDMPNQAGLDQGAFVSIMNSLNNPTDEQKQSIGKDLSNPNLFTEGAVNGMYNDYLDMVDAMAGMFEAGISEVTLNDGEIAILYTQNATHIAVGDTMPG